MISVENATKEFVTEEGEVWSLPQTDFPICST